MSTVPAMTLAQGCLEYVCGPAALALRPIRCLGQSLSTQVFTNPVGDSDSHWTLRVTYLVHGDQMTRRVQMPIALPGPVGRGRCWQLTTCSVFPCLSPIQRLRKQGILFSNGTARDSHDIEFLPISCWQRSTKEFGKLVRKKYKEKRHVGVNLCSWFWIVYEDTLHVILQPPCHQEEKVKPVQNGNVIEMLNSDSIALIEKDNHHVSSYTGNVKAITLPRSFALQYLWITIV